MIGYIWHLTSKDARIQQKRGNHSIAIQYIEALALPESVEWQRAEPTLVYATIVSRPDSSHEVEPQYIWNTYPNGRLRCYILDWFKNLRDFLCIKNMALVNAFSLCLPPAPYPPTGLCVAIGTAKLVKIFNITMESPHFQIKKLLCRRLQFMQNSHREVNFSSRWL